MQALAEARTSRWLIFLLITISINFGSAVYYPAFASDDFSWATLAASVGPVVWGLLLLFMYRTKSERRIFWLTAVAAVYWSAAAIYEFGKGWLSYHG